jgi:hypothetical protein
MDGPQRSMQNTLSTVIPAERTVQDIALLGLSDWPTSRRILLEASRSSIRRAAERRAGRFVFNQVSLNKDIWPQVAGSELLHLPVHILREDSYLYPLSFANETLLEHRFGRLVANIVATDAFPLQS